MNHFTV